MASLAAVLSVVAVVLPAASAIPPVHLVGVWVTTRDGALRLARQPSVSLGPVVPGGGRVITVDPARGYQSMIGFGAAFTDSSAWLVSRSPQRERVLTALFDPRDGIGLSALRQPVGASDFSRFFYTYDEVPDGQTDEHLRHFSVDHDRAYLLPLLRRARQLNPRLWVLASPLYPPTWMTTDSVDGPVLRASAEQEYARYLVRFLRAYAADGVPVDALTPQNEPLYVPEDMPGVLMSARQEARFVGTALGPALAQAGLRTAILVYDHNWDRPDYPAAVLADPVARRYVSGAAFHCYAGDVAAQSAVHGRFPDQDVYLTECSGVRSADPAATFGDTLDWQTEKLVIGATRNWARAVFTWNVALDPDGGPTIGPCATCTGVLTVDNRAGTVTYNAEYYVLGHASRFVAPGAVRVDSTSLGPGDVQDVAFRNPDGSIVLVALNTASTASTFTVSCGGRAFRYTLPPGAVATFRW